MNWTSHNINSGVVYNVSGGGYSNVQYPTSDPHVFDCGQFQNGLNGYFWEEQKRKDQEFIKEFVSNIEGREVVKKVNKSNIKIHEAKEKLLEIIALKNSLEEKARTIDIYDNDFDTNWIGIENKVKKVKELLMELVRNAEPLKKSLLKRLKKRRAIKKRNLKWLTQKKEAKRKIEEKHVIIDKLLSERADEVEGIKREAALKRQADAVLHEVRRKKYEGIKMLNMLSALEKLRDLKIKEEEKNGGYSSKKLTEVFNEVINRFKNLWEKQIEEYKLEEKGLKIILEANTLPPVKESKFEMNLLQWEKVLFGDVANTPEEKMMTCADNDLEAFLQVRRDWDQFLTTDSGAVSSGIPVGWVLPSETNDEKWKQYLVKSKGASCE